MTLCRTIAKVEAVADADSIGEAPLSQEAADRVAAILAPYKIGAASTARCRRPQPVPSLRR